MKKLGPVVTAAALVSLLAIGSGTPGFPMSHEKKPSGEIAEVRYLTATVEKIDHPTRMVTLKGPDGKYVILKGPRGNSEKVAVRNPKNLENVKVGDQVQLTYTEAMAIAVEPASPGK